MSFRCFISFWIIVSFFLTTLGPLPKAHADSVLGLPAPGTMINLSPAYQPVMIKGLTVHKDNPFLFDFIVDVGQDKMSGEPLKKEGEKLIKYFLASLAIPDKDVWVNLSPYEKNRMIPEALGQTDMGRDLLEQDYILKQITASLIYPEKQLGKTFWDTVYAKAQQMYGTTQVPVNTFNKVWILADRAEVFEHNQTAFVVDSHLKVMLEEDYLALRKHNLTLPLASRNDIHSVGANIVRTIILPELEKEVNTGKNFANLRQIVNSLILANWYKKNLKEALLNQVYANQGKVKGIDINDPTVKQQIYEQYLKAYKKGVFNYIKEDVTTQGGSISRKYFSGGFAQAPGFIDPAKTEDTATLNKAMISWGSLVLMLSGLLEHIRPQQAVLTQVRVVPAKVMLSGSVYNVDYVGYHLNVLEDEVANLNDTGVPFTEETSGKNMILDYKVLSRHYGKIGYTGIFASWGSLLAKRHAVDWGFRMIKDKQEWWIGKASVKDYLEWLRRLKEDLTKKIFIGGNIGGLRLEPQTVEIQRGSSKPLSVRTDDLDKVINGFLANMDNPAFSDSDKKIFEALAKIIEQSGFGKIENGQLNIPVKDRHDVEMLLNKLHRHIRAVYNTPAVFNPDAAMVVMTANAQNVRMLIRNVMNMPPENRVVVIVNTPFEDSNGAVIGFLNSGRTGIIALKGLKGVFNEFYFDGHPKAVGVSREALNEVGIEVPEDGILDPWTWPDRTELRAKILQLKDKLKLPLSAIKLLEKKKFEVLKTKNAQKIDISSEPFIFGEGKSVYANLHVLDLRVRDVNGQERVIRTYQNSPVITDEVKILGVGPETIKVWRKIVEGAQGVIVIGNDQGFEDVLKQPVDGQIRIYVEGSDSDSLRKLSDSDLWKPATMTVDDVGISDHGVRFLALGEYHSYFRAKDIITQVLNNLKLRKEGNSWTIDFYKSTSSFGKDIGFLELANEIEDDFRNPFILSSQKRELKELDESQVEHIKTFQSLRAEEKWKELKAAIESWLIHQNQLIDDYVIDVMTKAVFEFFHESNKRGPYVKVKFGDQLSVVKRGRNISVTIPNRIPSDTAIVQASINGVRSGMGPGTVDGLKYLIMEVYDSMARDAAMNVNAEEGKVELGKKDYKISDVLNLMDEMLGALAKKKSYLKGQNGQIVLLENMGDEQSLRAQLVKSLRSENRFFFINIFGNVAAISDTKINTLKNSLDKAKKEIFSALGARLGAIDIALDIMEKERAGERVVIIPDIEKFPFPEMSDHEISEYNKIMTRILNKAKRFKFHMIDFNIAINRNRLNDFIVYLMKLKEEYSFVPLPGQRLLDKLDEMVQGVEKQKPRGGKKFPGEAVVYAEHAADLLTPNKHAEAFLSRLEEMLKLLSEKETLQDSDKQNLAGFLRISPQEPRFDALWNKFDQDRKSLSAPEARPKVLSQRNIANDPLKKLAMKFMIISKRYDLAMAVETDTTTLSLGQRLKRKFTSSDRIRFDALFNDLKSPDEVRQEEGRAGLVGDPYIYYPLVRLEISKIEKILKRNFGGYEDLNRQRRLHQNLDIVARASLILTPEMSVGQALQGAAEEIHNLKIAAAQSSVPSFDTAMDKAMSPGGIDLNTSNGMQWKVTKDGNGVEMTVDPAMIKRIRYMGIDSLSPVIFRITPITSIWPLVGLQAPAQEVNA